MSSHHAVLLLLCFFVQDPVASLAFESVLKSVRDRLNAGEPLFQNLIKK